MQFIAGYSTKSLYIIIEKTALLKQRQIDSMQFVDQNISVQKRILSIEIALQKSAYQKNLTVYKISNFSNSKSCPINLYSNWVYR